MTVRTADVGLQHHLWTPIRSLAEKSHPGGGRIAKTALCSMVVHGSFAEWQS